MADVGKVLRLLLDVKGRRNGVRMWWLKGDDEVKVMEVRDGDGGRLRLLLFEKGGGMR